jgi:disulfide bond formation protein DsbB
VETTEQQLLAHAERQTKSLELLTVLAQVWSVLAAIGLVILLIAMFASRG